MTYWCPMDREPLRAHGEDLRYGVHLLFCPVCGRHYTYFPGDDELPELFQTQRPGIQYANQRAKETA